MSLISASIPNMVNGVSQQPAALRLASQAEFQENCMSSVVEGLTKRPPTVNLAKLSDAPYGAAYVHTINRDTSERYTVTISDGAVNVYKIGGGVRTVNAPDGTDYLNSTNPRASFKAITVADYTFIVNAERTVEMGGETTPDNGNEGLIFVKQANYQVTLKVTVDGQTASYEYPSNAPISTETAASELANNLSTLLGADYVFEQSGSVIYFYRTDGAGMTVSATDSAGDTQVTAIYMKVQRFSQLPTYGFGGITVEVVGDGSSSFDNYWVTFVPHSAGEREWGEGVWKETAEPGIPAGFDPATMPHVLVREADGTFTFRRQEWKDRLVGDEKSAPTPSFVGRKLNDIFFHKNRLGFLSDENVIFSEAAEYFNFWPTTVTTLVDSDPIDVAASHTKVSILRHAVPYNEQLLLFSDQTQFGIDKEELLASAPPTVNVLTEFESALAAKPIGVGRTVFFATPKGRNSGIREFYIEDDTRTQDAADVTAHVPTYIPSGVFKLAASPNEDILLALSAEAPNECFVYKYFWNGPEKMQSSWSKFVFSPNCKVLNADFIESSAFFVMEYPDGVYLERMDVEAGLVDGGVDFVYRLDRRVSTADCPVSYDANSNTSTVTLPYVPDADLEMVGCSGDEVGRLYTVTNVSGQGVTVQGQVGEAFIGQKYRQRYGFSRPVVKEQAPGGGQAVVGEGRLQVRFWSLNYAKSGYFQVTVSSQARNPKVYTFTGRAVGASSSVLGEVNLSSGVFKVPVMSRSDRFSVEITNDTYLPSCFVSAEWEAMYTIRSRRLR